MGRFDKKQNNRINILKILATSTEAISSAQIAEKLQPLGLDLSERSIRLYLNQLDKEGLTHSEGKKGRLITEKGEETLKSYHIMDHVGYMSTKINSLTYQMDFDLTLRRGTVVINIAIVEKKILLKYWDQIFQVFEKGYAMGTLVSLLYPGDKSGDIIIPAGKLGLCTVCSITLNGVLLKHGIPTRSIFSGLLELRNSTPIGFSDIINYEGTSIDPLQLFIRSRMTDYLGAIRNGNGRIGSGFREIPKESYQLALSLSEKLKALGLGAFLQIGPPGKELMNIPVSEGSCGVIVIGGLNPIAILEENNAPVTHYALASLMEFNRLFPYTEMKEKMMGAN